MTIIDTNMPTTELGGPFAATPAARAGANMYGAFSIESFCDQGSLSSTHEDAAGFLAYPEQFTPRNFWYKDAGVKVWAYYEDFDNWQDTYGIDAVRVAYHSGHGGMDANGVFYVPMGAAWAGNDCTATSTRMRLGNEHARYAFWSTCLSLRVLDGHTPIRTWSAANQGLRMIFGFETVSWDSADYGKNFWKHWRNNESFSSAWLNASWDIAHDQAPSVAACGASQAEAAQRLNSERLFEGTRSSTNWWWWRWYNVAQSVAREPNGAVPAQLRRAVLEPTSARTIARLGQQFDIDPGIRSDRAGSTTIGDADRSLSLGAGGLTTVHLASPNTANLAAIPRPDAVRVGGDAVRRYGLDAEAPLVLDRVVEIREAGASTASDTREAERTVETLIQYRQLIDGVPIISGDAGVVAITIDNDGKATRIQSTTRSVAELSERPRGAVEPSPPGQPRATASAAADNPDAALANAFGTKLRAMLAVGSTPVGYSRVPGTKEIGYEIRGDSAVLAAKQAVELEFEEGYRKRIWVVADLFE